MTRHVIFKSNRFSNDHDDGHEVEQPPGLELGTWLIQELLHNGLVTDSMPSTEDFGWYFRFGYRELNHICIITFRPSKDGSGDEWIIGIEKSCGLLSRIFGAHRRVKVAAPLAIHAALLKANASDIRWYLDDDLAREENPKGQPMDS